MLLDSHFWQLRGCQLQRSFNGIASGDSVPPKQRGTQLKHIFSTLLAETTELPPTALQNVCYNQLSFN